MRARFLVGAALGAAVGIWLSLGALADARRALLDESQERQAVVSLSALAALLQSGEDPQQAVAKWLPAQPSVARVRVARGMQLLASSAAEDKAPRRLQRDEKPLYDRAQRLATAVQTNRDEGARKPEIEVAWLDGRRLSLAAPLEGSGIVEIETGALPGLPPFGSLALVLAAIAALGALALLAWRIGERPVPLAIASAILLGGVLAWSGRAIVQNRQAYLYIAPAMIGLLILVFFPFFYGIVLSFTDSNLYNTSSSIPELWVGLRNYGDILGDFGFIQRVQGGFAVNYLNFYWTLLFTIVWTVSNVTIGVT
ncbi:MAG: hypothetical protein ACXWLM_01920, partial [Myxococcales bacterium]